MASSELELLKVHFDNIYNSLPERVKRPDLLWDDALKLVFELGKYTVLAEQLYAKGAALEITDEASYAEGGRILSEVDVLTRECKQKCDSVLTDLEMFEKFYTASDDIGKILEAKIAEYDRRDRRRKLSPAQVQEMHREYDAGQTTMRQLAKRFGISVSTVSNIINRRCWKD